MSLPHITFVDLQDEFIQEIRKTFHTFGGLMHLGEEAVSFVSGDWLQCLPTDCVVSPANSFGLMDGGFDLALTNYFGPELQKTVRHFIREEHCGEQPVGTCLIVETGNETCPFVAHTPTMRLPSNLAGTDNAYYAMKAMLIETMRHPDIERVVCTGLGTFYGDLRLDVAADLMAYAYLQVQDSINMPQRLTPTAGNEELWPQARIIHQTLQQFHVGRTNPSGAYRRGLDVGGNRHVASH